jgi:hypothetical protein
MPDAMDIQPFRRALLSPAKLVADIGIEYFRPAPRERAQAGLTQRGQRIGDG